MNLKDCPKCERSLNKELFSPSNASLDGLYSWCRECKRNSHRMWRENNREKMRLASTRWKENNNERVKKYCRDRRVKNREKILATEKSWRSRNPFLVKAFLSNARALARGAIKKIPPNLLAEKIKTIGMCEYCGDKCQPLGFDHRVPLSRNGKHTIKNLSVCCIRCNQRKHTKTVAEFKKYAVKVGIKLII